GIIGVALIGIAPALPLAIVGAALFGASQGTFLAVDWALMTDIIPKAASGRYMGLSNVVTASATTIAVTIGGPLIDTVTKAREVGTGERLELASGVTYSVVGALLRRPVREPRHQRQGDQDEPPDEPGIDGRADRLDADEPPDDSRAAAAPA